MELSDVIELEKLQEIQDCFAESTSFAAITVDFKGKPILKYSNFSGFCQKLRSHPKYYEKCNNSDAHGGLEAVRRNDICIYKCYAGLIDFAIPIVVDGQFIATMMCGQVLAEEGQDIASEILAKTSQLFLDDQELLDLYNKIPVIPYRKIEQTAKLMFLTLNYIIKQYALNKKNLKLLMEQKEKVELENEIKNWELKFYQSQINPHFLFNTLNIAGRMAYLEKANKTQEIIYALADMYRYFLQDATSKVAIEEEIFMIKNYIFIQKIRFSENMELIIDIDSSIKDFKIPSMVIQLLIENSVLHGLNEKEEGGIIKVTAKNIENEVIISIYDNGVGIPQEKVEAINNAKLFELETNERDGVGIFNVHKRMQHFYKNNYSLSVSSDIMKYTKFELKIPIDNLE